MENSSAAPGRRLNGVDAAFIYLERKEIPLHIASVSVFDDVIPYEEFVAAIDSKLHLIPRYRQIVVSPPYNLDYPTWEYDPNFDIHRHIVRARVDPPGGEAELEALASRILTEVLDRSKPLWEIHVIEGLKDGRGALVARVHHALADGIAGAALLKVMLDPTPQGSRAIPKPRVPRPEPRAPEPSIASLIGNALRGTLSNLVAAEMGFLELAMAVASGRMTASIEGLLSLLPELARPVERLPFNKPCGSGRKFCWAEMEFADVQAIRAALGGTVNDVMLTVVTRAISRYVKLHGETVRNRFVRVVCPISFRTHAEREALGNRISFLPVVLPMDVRDPVRNLRAVATRMEIMKGARAGDLVALAASWLAIAPPPVQKAIWTGISHTPLPVPLFNIICTNVPGSPVPLYAVGRRMLTSYPHVPTGYDLGVGCAMQSYDGKLFFGLTADAEAASDVGRLRDFLRVSFEELCRAAGICKAPPRKTTARKALPRPARPVKAIPQALPEPAPPVADVEPAPEAPAKTAPEPLVMAARADA